MSTTTMSRWDVDAVECILDQFNYWHAVSDLSTFTNFDNLRTTYEHQSGPTHYFDRETVRFFGSRNMHMHRPGLMIETQTNAPEGVHRYKVTAWIYDDTATADHRGGPRLTPQGLGSCATLAEARKLAESAHRMWAHAQKAHRLRAAGTPGGALELLEVLEVLAALD